MAETYRRYMEENESILCPNCGVDHTKAIGNQTGVTAVFCRCGAQFKFVRPADDNKPNQS